jgi:hypothetical protein
VLAVGEDQEVPVDVRIIAATNRDPMRWSGSMNSRRPVPPSQRALHPHPSCASDPRTSSRSSSTSSAGAEQADHPVPASREFVQALRRVELRVTRAAARERDPGALVTRNAAISCG